MMFYTDTFLIRPTLEVVRTNAIIEPTEPYLIAGTLAELQIETEKYRPDI
jgi:hypothetical protein